MPDIHPPFVAIGVAVVLNFFLGYAWYTPLFGRAWATARGLPAGHSVQGKQLALGLLSNIAGCFLVALVLGNNIAAWTPSTWGLEGEGINAISQALQAACFTWLGFFLPPLLNGVFWEMRSWKLTSINGGYSLVSLVVASLVITHLR